MKKMVNLAKLLISFGVLFSIQVQGALITSYTNPVDGVVDFSESPGGQYNNGATLDVGVNLGEEIILSTRASTAFYTNGVSISLNENGFWDNAGGTASYAATFGGILRFDFLSGPVSMVGGMLNYARGRNNAELMLTALGSAGEVLESYNVTEQQNIITPGATNEGEFRGIQRDQQDIYGFLIEERAAGRLVIDDFTFSRQGGATAIPEPHIISIFALGLLAIAFRRIRRS